MIKRIQFVTRSAAVPASEFQSRWLGAVEEAEEARLGVRPLRVVACVVRRGVQGSDALHDGICIQWCEDIDAVRRLEGAEPPLAASLVDPAATICILVEESVMRGADWLEQRWARRAVKWKHMALARRAAGLSSAEFSRRWRNRPGRIGGAGSALAVQIPVEARGRAYVQNHPIAPDAQYDAINEVYFDDFETMRARLDFFEIHAVGRADSDLVSEARFAVVREHVIL